MTMPPQPPRRRRRRPRAQPGAPGPVVITQREMYDLLVEVHDTVADLASDLTGHAKDVSDVKTEQAKHAERITRLERWMWRAAGAAGVGGAVLGLLLGDLVRIGPA